MSSTEQFAHACSECRKLITRQLEAREQLGQALAQSPDGPMVNVLRDKVRKLTARTEEEFLRAMNALPNRRS